MKKAPSLGLSGVSKMSDLVTKIKEEAERAKTAQIDASKIKDEVLELKKHIKAIVEDSEKWTRDALELMQSSVDAMTSLRNSVGSESIVISSVEPEKVDYKFVVGACFVSAILSAAITAFLLN